MSTLRRTLGTGPMSTTPTAVEERSPRLLPVERADPDHDQEHGQEPVEPGGPRRRQLGDRGRQTEAAS
ncbi:hypothetical protein [Streptomyces tendae]|uniref:hypothetical protein n=1 Tax=Streptomyces tendae TaxID=1932 RepID=UPI00249032F2|nr:hypothetical protein [Streptomyces tendae]